MSEVARGSTDLAVAPRRGGTTGASAAPAVLRSSSSSSSRLVAREGSFRVYYTGSSGAIPFKWEARPGTPKHPSAPAKSSSMIPPLTPPPSFLSPGNSTPSQRLLRNRHQHRHHATQPLGFRIMAGLVPKLFLWKRHVDPRGGGGRSPKSVVSWAKTASSTSTSSSSSESEAVASPSGSPLRSCASSRRTRRGRSRFSSFSSTGTSSGAVYDEEAEARKEKKEDDDEEESSWSPTTRGGVWRKSSGGFSGCSANVVAVKRALMSVVVGRAHGSGGQSATAPRKLGGTSRC